MDRACGSSSVGSPLNVKYNSLLSQETDGGATGGAIGGITAAEAVDIKKVDLSALDEEQILSMQERLETKARDNSMTFSSTILPSFFRCCSCFKTDSYLILVECSLSEIPPPHNPHLSLSLYFYLLSM